ncbi:hypothetical protein PF003_g26260 [Phytophthora fragariae]|nr:hypothetical protein PF003_g26260 [Phytophthora fragariae]
MGLVNVGERLGVHGSTHPLPTCSFLALMARAVASTLATKKL